MPCPKMNQLAAATTLLAALMLNGCVIRGYPTHGGGKRFFQEQALVAGSIDAALAQIDFEQLGQMVPEVNGIKSIGVHLFSMSHSGGGVQTGSTGFLGSLFGAVPVLAAGEQVSSEGRPIAPTVVAAGNAAPGYLAYAFESADDIRYLMGRLIARLGSAGLSMHTAEGDAAEKPTLCILVRQLGIDQSDFTAIVYSEKLLRARATIEAFVVHRGAESEDSKKQVTMTTPLGTGVGAMRLREDYFLGFGPISGGSPEAESAEGAR